MSKVPPDYLRDRKSNFDFSLGNEVWRKEKSLRQELGTPTVGFLALRVLLDFWGLLATSVSGKLDMHGSPTSFQLGLSRMCVWGTLYYVLATNNSVLKAWMTPVAGRYRRPYLASHKTSSTPTLSGCPAVSGQWLFAVVSCQRVNPTY